MICAVASALASGCANGWPRVHHHQTANVDCVPTGSKIGRSDCTISQPTTSTGGGDMDANQQQGMGNVVAPVQGPAGPR
jgi:hypothetical protein